jgi:biopolymer transport protein ExbD
MSKIAPPIDMTPMVDLAFLLVTFFMLTATAIPDEPVSVDTPSSVSQVQIPENDILTITVGKDNKVFFNVDGQHTRAALIEKIGERYAVTFTPQEQRAFIMMSSIGVPVGSLKQFLSMSPEERKYVNQPGIPVDSLNNQLADWVLQARLSNPRVRIAIKGDRDSDYGTVRKVVSTLLDRKVNRFNLVTNMEKGQE